ncbi:type I-E CRISPR-associated protein Cas6/Cse3/CasE [Phreatobacter stygius]|uniref:Type I-E CRISPR-associated protein Cas6/Cse3/CasE n=1 Tax=Phreatobacter stygius TaxID=1940610 RepID=A0A4D7BG46_9HYPH|nr:type I-E CRISPR-associated protein Cas6/Cse3/CasE [Phreatobacter stygius]QCI66842.1 type I-E CRISPR-associated protein Cas6/Cse3/CasE [Phreatobacter stygius]
MSFLTLAELRRDTPQARAYARLLLDSSIEDSAHRLVWLLFGDKPDAERDFLFREAEPGRFLVVSQRQPAGEEAIWSLKSRPYQPAPTKGRRYGFSLRANPTVSLSQPGRARSLVRDVLLHAKKQAGRPLTPEEREAAALAWLTARGERMGVTFDPMLCQAKRYDLLKVSRKKEKGKGSAHPAEFTVVDFEGVLTVDDPAALETTLRSGIGKGRAYGLGLMLLRPLGD